MVSRVQHKCRALILALLFGHRLVPTSHGESQLPRTPQTTRQHIMQSSMFSYNVTRRYRYAWFTPTVLVGGLAFLILFSVVNYASTGYRFVIQQSTTPNVTVDKYQLPGWTQFVAHGLRPSCQPTTIDVGSTVITTNNALLYTITSVQNNGERLPSLLYRNNPLNECTVTSINIFMDLMDRSAAQMSASPWGIELRGEVSCLVYFDNGQVRLNMSAQWDPVAAQDRYGGSIAQFFGRNETSRASLYWGESLLSNYRVRMQDQLWRNNSNSAWNSTTKVSWGVFARGS